MGRWTAFVLAGVAAGATAAGAARLPGLLARVEAFRVADVRLEGARYLQHDAAVAAMELAPDANVWDDPGPWERGLRAHPLVRDVRVRRRLPSTLVAEVEEWIPVALVPTPTLEPVSREGRILPVDPARYRLDLPVLRPAGGAVPASGAEGPPAPLRRLSAEIARLGEIDPSFLALVSEAAEGPDGAVVARFGEPTVAVRFRPPLAPQRLRDGLRVLADAMRRRPETRPTSLDLRFAGQVVVGYP